MNISIQGGAHMKWIRAMFQHTHVFRVRVKIRISGSGLHLSLTHMFSQDSSCAVSGWFTGVEENAMSICRWSRENHESLNQSITLTALLTLIGDPVTILRPWIKGSMSMVNISLTGSLISILAPYCNILLWYDIDPSSLLQYTTVIWLRLQYD
jgi:hypothetical protein